MSVPDDLRLARIGVVDGDALMRERIRRWLLPACRVVAEAGSVAAASDWLETPPIDGVLVEKRLPDGDGWCLGHHFKQAHPSVEVFLYTAHGVPGMRPPGLHWLDQRDMVAWPRRVARVFHDQGLS